MGQADSKLAFKNKVFMLAGSADGDTEDDMNAFIASDDPYWNMFWEEPTSADDIYSLLTFNDIKTLRDANKYNFIKLVRVIVLKLIKTARHQSFPSPKAQPSHLLNCIRVLNRIIPFLFEMTEWNKEINNLFWSIGYNGWAENPQTSFTAQATVGSFSSDPRGLTSLETGTTKPNINVDLRQIQNSTQGNVGSSLQEKPLGQELMSVLVDLLFTREFTLPPTGIKGPDYVMWEVGIGHSGKYTAPNPELDSNRLEVLRLLVTLTSQGLFQTPKTTVAEGSRFLTTLVCTTSPRNKLLTLICSLLNVVCRSCKADADNNGLTYSSPANNHQYSSQKFYDLRSTFVTYTLQLLTLMLVYPLPQQDLAFLHRLDMLPKDQTPRNLVRNALAQLHKENELNFVYSSMISLLLRPIQEAIDNEANPFNLLKNNFSGSPTSPMSVQQNTFKSSMPSLSSWTTEIVVLIWELIQCNKNFKNFVYSKKVQELMVTTLYYIKFYRNDPIWKPNLIRILCYFTLYLSSDDLVTTKLLSPFPSSYYSNQIPNFYKLNTSGPPSNLSYRDFLVIQICTMLTTDDFDITITPNLFEYLYNLLPLTHTDSNSKLKVILPYITCIAILNVIKKYSLEPNLKDPLKMDLLALLMRAIAHSVCRYHKESRTLLYALAKNEKVLLNLLQSVQTLTFEFDSDEAVAPDKGVTTTTLNTPVTRSPEPGSPNGGENFEGEDDGIDGPDLEYEESLRPTPLTGMSTKAKSKLPADAPLMKTWAGYRALKVVMRAVKLVKEEVQIPVDGSRSDVVETLINIENIPNYQEKVSKFVTAEFLPKSKLEPLTFNWSHLSLGWYESIVWGTIVFQNITMAKNSASSSWYKRSSAISFKDVASVASSWGFSWKSKDSKPTQIFHFDSSILQLNIWNGAEIKLFKIRRPIEEKPIVDMTNLMKRFRLNSAASIQTTDSRVRQNSTSTINSPNQLTPINSRQSFGTPRNSVSVTNNRESIYSLSRQNSYMGQT